METSELTGVQLDWAVAKCEGYFDIDMASVRDGVVDVFYFGSYKPSTDWALGGAIIEREGITVAPDDVEPWCAYIDRGTAEDVIYGGTTPLIAAMRCYVASKLGDEVELPEEL
jgi:hypothetical protein